MNFEKIANKTYIYLCFMQLLLILSKKFSGHFISFFDPSLFFQIRVTSEFLWKFKVIKKLLLKKVDSLILKILKKLFEEFLLEFFSYLIEIQLEILFKAHLT